MAAGDSPVSKISAKTCWAMALLMVLPSTRAINSTMYSGLNFKTASVVPAAGRLGQPAAPLQHLDLAGDFIFQGLPHAAEAVHVFDLDLCPEFPGALRAHAHVHVATDHPLLHVAIAHPAIDQDVLERV